MVKRKPEFKLAIAQGFRLNKPYMNNVFVNAILATAGMAAVISLGILNMVATPPHGFLLGLLGFVFSIILIVLLSFLYEKKPAAGWAVLIAGTIVLYFIGGPHLFNFSLLGFCWAFSKIGCLSIDEH
jgi:hypothetical protein